MSWEIHHWAASSSGGHHRAPEASLDDVILQDHCATWGLLLTGLERCSVWLCHRLGNLSTITILFSRGLVSKRDGKAWDSGADEFSICWGLHTVSKTVPYCCVFWRHCELTRTEGRKGELMPLELFSRSVSPSYGAFNSVTPPSKGPTSSCYPAEVYLASCFWGALKHGNQKCFLTD